MTNHERIRLVTVLTRCDGILPENIEGREISSPSSYRLIGGMPERRGPTATRIYRDGRVADMNGGDLSKSEITAVDKKLIVLLNQKLHQVEMAMKEKK